MEGRRKEGRRKKVGREGGRGESRREGRRKEGGEDGGRGGRREEGEC